MEQDYTNVLPPSPLDPTMRALDICDIASVVVALYCGWQLGEWWGIGLALSVLAANFLNAYRASRYRDEIWEGVSNLVSKLDIK